MTCSVDKCHHVYRIVEGTSAGRGIKIGGGVLVHGPPATDKVALVTQGARKLGVNLIKSDEAFILKKHLLDLFEDAKKR